MDGIFNRLQIKKGEKSMKAKRFDKKLALNKTTIADLSNHEMGKIQGGISGESYCECEPQSDLLCVTKCPAGGNSC